MSLEQLQERMNDISGVLYTNIIEARDTKLLQVAWHGEPADYKQKVKEARENTKGTFQQVNPSDYGELKEKEEAMPVQYYLME